MGGSSSTYTGTRISSRIGHKKISATDIANDVNDYFKENGLDRSVNANLLGHRLSSFKSKLFNDAKLKVPWNVTSLAQYILLYLVLVLVYSIMYYIHII